VNLKIEDIKEEDKFICTKQVNNLLGWSLFNEGESYTVLHVDGDEVFLDHVLYANEYLGRTIDFINENFKRE